MKQKFISIFLILSFVLPMGISLSHAMHDHESFVCKSKNEYHSHPEQTKCDQFHFINHSLSDQAVPEFTLNLDIRFNNTGITSPHLFGSTFLLVASDRGPPFINV